MSYLLFLTSHISIYIFEIIDRNLVKNKLSKVFRSISTNIFILILQYFNWKIESFLYI